MVLGREGERRCPHNPFLLFLSILLRARYMDERDGGLSPLKHDVRYTSKSKVGPKSPIRMCDPL
jgi:hypothetical protein